MSSNVIDERIVQLKFDNKDFEKNVKDSIKTIDDLKENLNFDDSVKSLEELEQSTKKMSFNDLLDTTYKLASAFDHITNIISKLTNAIKQIPKIVDPFGGITTGFSKYEEKTKAVQTIMAATGLTIDEVNNQLARLMWFTDETSYSFTDMTTNIGKFTSQGVELETAATAMQGISTWAAVSGQGINEASRAMYNLSQAIGVGAVKLMDWKSIQNANMATTEFKETVLDTAVELNTLKKSADGVFKTIGKGTEVTIQNFSETLSESWFTSDVLLKTLEKYGSFANGINEIYELFDGEIPTSQIITDIRRIARGVEPIKTYTTEAYEKMAILADEIDSVGAKAFFASQEAKTFTEAIGSVKEAVSSGWATTYELIFGNYVEAKELWTNLANYMYEVFATSAEKRNNLISDGFHDSVYTKLIDELGRVGIEQDEFTKSLTSSLKTSKLLDRDIEELVEEYGSLEKVLQNEKIDKYALSSLTMNVVKSMTRTSESVEETTGSLEYFNDIVDRVINSEFGNGENRFTKLEELGYNASVVQSMVNEKLKTGSINLSNYTKEQLAVATSTKDVINLTEEEIDSIKELTLSLAMKSSREILLDALYDAFERAIAFINMIKEEFSSVWEVFTGEGIYNAVVSIANWIKSLKLTEKQTESVKKIVRSFATVMKGLFNITKTVVNVFFDLLGLLSPLAEFFLNIFVCISDLVVKISEFIDSLFNIKSINLKDFGKKLLNSFKTLDFKKIKTDILEFFRDLFKEVKKCIEGINFDEIVLDAKKSLKDFSETFLGSDIVSNISSWFEGIKNSVQTNPIGRLLASPFVLLYNTFSKINFNKIFQNVKDFLGNLKIENFGEKINSFAESIEKFDIKKIFVKIGDSFSYAKDTLVKIIYSTCNALKSAFTFIGSTTSTIAKEIFGLINQLGTASINFATNVLSFGPMLSTAFAILSTILVLKAGGLLDAIKKHIIIKFGSVLTATKRYMDSKTAMNVSNVLLSISTSVLILSFAVKNLIEAVNNLGDEKEIWSKLGAIVTIILAIAIVIGLITYAIIKAKTKADSQISLSIDAVKQMIEKTDILGDALLTLNSMVNSIADGLKTGAVAAIIFAFILGILAIFKIVKEIVKSNNFVDYAEAFGLITVFMAVFGGLIYAIAKSTKGASLSGMYSIIGIIAVLKLLIDSIADLAQVNQRNLTNVTSLINDLLATLLVFTSIFSIISSKWHAGNKDLYGIAVLIFAVGLTLKIIVSAINDIIGLEWNDIVKGITVTVAAFGIVLGFIWLLTIVSKKSLVSVDIKNIMSLALLLISIGMVLKQIVSTIKELAGMDDQEFKNGAKKLASILGILGIFIFGISTTKLAITGVKDLALALVSISVAFKIMESLDSNKIIPNAVALGIALLALGGATAIASLVGKTMVGDLKFFLGIGVCILAIAGALYILDKIDIDGLYPKALALGGLMLALGGSIALSNAFAKSSSIGVMLQMIVIIIGIVAAIYLLKDIETNKLTSIVIALGGLMIALGGSIALANTFAKDWKTSLAILPLMIAAAAIMFEIACILKDLANNVSDPNKLLTISESLSLVMASMAGSLALLSLTNINFSNGISIALGFVEFVGILGIVLTALGGLVETFDKEKNIEKFLERASSVMNAIGNAIGSLVGGLFSGIFTGKSFSEKIEDFSKSLDTLGDSLESLTEFVGIIKEISIEDVNKISILSDILGELNNLAGIELNPNLNSSIGTTISSFAESVGEMVEAFKDIDATAVNNVAAFGTPLADLLGTIKDTMSFDYRMMYSADAEDVENSPFVVLAESIKEMVNKFAEVDESAFPKLDGIITRLPSFFETLNSIPATGGLVQLINGGIDIEKIGIGLGSLGEGLSSFFSKFNSETDYETGIDIMGKVSEPLKTFFETLKGMPTSGGLLSELFKGTFDFTNLKIFGAETALLFSKMETVDEGNITKLGKVNGPLKKFFEALAVVPKDLYGQSKSKIFENFEKFGTDICKLIASFSETKEEDMTKFKNVSGIFKTFAESLEIMPKKKQITDIGEGLNIFTPAFKTFIETITTLGDVDLEEIKTQLIQINEAILYILENFFNDEGGYQMYGQNINETGVSIIDKLVSGMQKGYDENSKDITNVAKDIMNSFAEPFELSVSSKKGGSWPWRLGKNVVQGFADGINDNASIGILAVKSFAQRCIEAAEAAFDEHSPSKVFGRIGAFCVKGLSIGIQDQTVIEEQNVKKSLDSFVNTAIDSLYIPDNILSITPIIDLSQAQKGLNSLNSMVSGNKAISIQNGLNSSYSQSSSRSNQETSPGIVFNQYNNSPKALSTGEIYRRTKSQFAQFTNLDLVKY